MSIVQMHANLAHACSVAQALKKNLSKVTQPSVIIESLTSASEAIKTDLKATPSNQVQVLTDLKEARDSVRLIATSIDALAQALRKRKGGQGITFQAYRTQLSQIADEADGATLLLDNAKVLIDKEISLDQQKQKKGSATSTISFQEFLNSYETSDSDAVMQGLASQMIRGLSTAELERLLTRRGPQFQELHMVTSSADLRIILELARTESVGRGSSVADRRDVENNLRARQAVEGLRKLKNDHASKVASLNVPEAGVRSVEVPLRVTFAGSPKLETLAKNGMPAEVFTTEKFSNGAYVVKNQRLIVFRRSDAEQHHRDQINASRRTNSEIKQLKNLNARCRAMEKEIAELEESMAKNKPTARKAIAQQIAELNAQLSDYRNSIAAIEGSANAAKRAIKATDRRAKSASDEMVFEYANHLLDMVNERYSIPYAQVTGKMLHKVTNPDYVYMWVAPRHNVRELLAIAGKQGELIKAWTLAWL